MAFFYSALCYLLFPLALPVLLLHPKLRHGIGARFGLHPRGWPDLAPGGPRIWLHGASAGDVLALVPLARALKARRPRVALILSTITNTGRAIAQREHDAFDAITYSPYDLPGSVRRTLRRLEPDVLVLEYTELWPHLIRAAARSGVAVVLHNGRFAASRLGRYRLLFRWAGNLLSRLRLLLLRSDAEAERAESLGAPADRIRVTGNTKVDQVTSPPPAELIEAVQAAIGSTAGPTWVAGSTHAGEEEILLQAFGELRRSFPELRLVIAPRYVERAAEIIDLGRARGWKTGRRSQPPLAGADVIVLDTIGELPSAYAIADLVFVGGSFTRRGGHNILEPAACGKPVLFGPHAENIADSVRLLLGRGALQVASPEQLTAVAAGLLAKPETCQELGDLARRSVTEARGAAARNAELILDLLPDL